jgi:radical SAM superfamily enzyme YgiQ (UPF0313 family)
MLPKKFKVRIIDENYEAIDFEQDVDLVVLSAMTQQADRAYEIAQEFKKRKNIKVVIGGIHSTLLPLEAKRYVDSVFIGEGENIWKQFLADLSTDDVKPFYKSLDLVNLKKSPLPRFDLLNPNYHKRVWVQTSRGCPIDCEFCAASKVFGKRIRHKDIFQIKEEIRFIKDIWKTPHINFADDNMFLDKRYGMEMVKAIKSFDIRWTAQTDISIADNEYLLPLMHDAGCEILFIGFESLSSKNLEKIDQQHRKAKYVKGYAKAIQKIQSFGIGVMGAFMVGLDDDDKEAFQVLTDFIIKNNLFGAQVTILTPLPGTRLRKRLSEENRIINTSWNNYTGFDVNFIPNKMTGKELQEGFKEVYKKIYSPEVRVRKLKYFKDIYASLLRRKNTI